MTEEELIAEEYSHPTYITKCDDCGHTDNFIVIHAPYDYKHIVKCKCGGYKIDLFY